MGKGLNRVLISSAVLATVGIAAGIAYTAAAVAVARHVVTPRRRHIEDVLIHSVAPDLSAVTLSGSPDLRVPGKYSLWFSNESGHAKIGQIISADDESVTRAVERLEWGDLAAARRGRFGGWYYTEPTELGLPVRSIELPVDDGTAPAWLFPSDGSADLWAIHVHGRGVRRQETLRAVPVFHDKGFTSLTVSYRNDEDAPDSTDHRYGLGATEWRDVDSAIAYAQSHGAKHVVLFGWSMGGAIALQAAVRSPHADVVRGIVLDSPVIDWVETLRFQAGELRLPGPVTDGALKLLDAQWANGVIGQDAPIGLGGLDFTLRAHELTVPVLLMHSDDDGFVPPSGSHRLAHLRPDIVTFVPFTKAKHTKLWNYDADRWVTAIAEWLDELVAKLDGSADHVRNDASA